MISIRLHDIFSGNGINVSKNIVSLFEDEIRRILVEFIETKIVPLLNEIQSERPVTENDVSVVMLSKFDNETIKEAIRDFEKVTHSENPYEYGELLSQICKKKIEEKKGSE